MAKTSLHNTHLCNNQCSMSDLAMTTQCPKTKVNSFHTKCHFMQQLSTTRSIMNVESGVVDTYIVQAPEMLRNKGLCSMERL